MDFEIFRPIQFVINNNPFPRIYISLAYSLAEFWYTPEFLLKFFVKVFSHLILIPGGPR